MSLVEPSLYQRGEAHPMTPAPTPHRRSDR